MLTFRLIARLDIKSPDLIKTVRMEGTRKLGDPYEYASRYDQEGIDEILYVDVVASLYGRNALGPLVDRTTRDVFCPVTVGGGIRTVEDAAKLFRAGADKVCINTAAVANPGLITEIARKFGSQAITLQLDAKKHERGWSALCAGGRNPTGREAVEWARTSVELGAGEILLTSVDREGTGRGLDIELCATVAGEVSVPVVVCGGVGSVSDILAAAKVGVNGVVMANVLHFNKLSLAQIRQGLMEAGINVRQDSTRGAQPDGQGSGIHG